jgi:hypothetical protein
MSIALDDFRGPLRGLLRPLGKAVKSHHKVCLLVAQTRACGGAGVGNLRYRQDYNKTIVAEMLL